MGIETTGLEEIKDFVREIQGTLSDIRSLYSKIEDELNVIVDDSISSQRSATTGQKYKDLTATTQKLSNKRPRPALYSRSLGGKPKIKMTTRGSDGIILYSDLPYAGVHQFGNPDNTLFGSDAPIPARPFMPIKKNGQFTERFLNRIEEITEEWLDERLNK